MNEASKIVFPGMEEAPKFISPGRSKVLMGYSCDTPKCSNFIMAKTELSVLQTLIREGWLTETKDGVLTRAWCPQCRKGRVTIGV